MPTATAPQMTELLALIERIWGYRELRPLQQPAMQAFLEHRDSLTVLPTGGGKSLCYQAPAILLSEQGHGPTVVVSPLIALMKDQVDSLRELGVAAAQLDSSISAEDRRQVAHDLRNGRLHMLFLSPERLVGSFTNRNENPDEESAEPTNPQRNWLHELLIDSGVKNFAIDEAHCISHWGHDFRPEYRQLARLKEIFPDAAVHAFTATATTQVRKDVAEQLQLQNPELLVGNFDRPNLTYRVLPRRDMFGQIREVLDRHPGEAGIIYCMRRKDVDEISSALAKDKTLNRPVSGYHAGMTPDLRRRVQEDFLNEKTDIIVATVAFGMGIDRSNIRFVLHTAMPKSVEAYQQETGRAGRDGLEADCVLLYSAADGISWRSLSEKSTHEAGTNGVKIDPKYLPSVLKHIDEMDRFARGATCRHRALVEYFGQQYQGPPELDDAEASRAVKGCGACDQCLGDTTILPDATVVAQKILSCIARTEQRFGAGHVISILRGEKNERIRSLHHDELSTHGLLAGFSQTEIRDYIYQLIGQGALAQENLMLSNGRSVPIPKLNTRSWEVMKGKHEVRLVQIVHKTATESRKTRGEAISWEGVDQELFETLRMWRKKTADHRNVPPFHIFSDATLRELARARPTTPQNFRLVYGIGEQKSREFGKEVTDIITTHCQEKHVESDRMANTARLTPAAATAGFALTASRREAAGYFRQGLPLDAVAIKMRRAKSTILEYLQHYIETEKPAAITTWIPVDTYQKIAAAIRQTGQGTGLKPIFIALEEKIPYDQIRLVAAHVRAITHTQ